MLFVVALIALLMLPRCLERRRSLALLARGPDGVAAWNRRRRARTGPPDLRCSNFAGLDLCGVDFSRMDLRASNFAKTRLAGANLTNADLRRCNLQGADLRGAQLRGANLKAANLNRANLKRADLRGADVRRAWLRDAPFDHKTRWPDGFDPAKQR